MISGGVTSRAASVTICPPRLLSQQSGTFCNNGIPNAQSYHIYHHSIETSLHCSSPRRPISSQLCIRSVRPHLHSTILTS
ncbi:hypothetical protein E4U51_004428 [Claviceps purpurea]|nr:hypothetical protein E4U51_004428 [Claviceps purpurea]